jgi:hypothetical protein
MRRNLVRGGVVGGAAACAALLGLSGCELLVDFDRSKIPNDSGVATFAIEGGGDSTMGTPAPDGGDAGMSSNADATAGDAPSESAVPSEAAPDSPTSTSDAPSETNSPTEAGPDGSKEASTPPAEAAAEAAVEAGVDSSGGLSADGASPSGDDGG